MALILDKTFFVGETLVAQAASSAAVEAELLEMIAYREPEYLKKILGQKLYDTYVTQVAASNQDYKDIRDGVVFTDRFGNIVRWEGLSNKGLSSLALYVYYHWQRSHVTISTGSGEKKISKGASEDYSSAAKQVTAWNRMVNFNCMLHEFLYVNEEKYPDYFYNGFSNYMLSHELYRTINLMGI